MTLTLKAKQLLSRTLSASSFRDTRDEVDRRFLSSIADANLAGLDEANSGWRVRRDERLRVVKTKNGKERAEARERLLGRLVKGPGAAAAHRLRWPHSESVNFS